MFYDKICVVLSFQILEVFHILVLYSYFYTVLCKAFYILLKKYPKEIYVVKASLRHSVYLLKVNNNSKQKKSVLNNSLYILYPISDVIITFNLHVTLFILFTTHSIMPPCGLTVEPDILV